MNRIRKQIEHAAKCYENDKPGFVSLKDIPRRNYWTELTGVHWVFDPKQLLIRHARGESFYYVDLERCGSSAEVLDWIMQIAKKTWASPGCIGELVHFLRIILDPQSTMCSFGSEVIDE